MRIFFSATFLLNRNFLWLLFIVNLAGTIYGYMWYENQLIWTIQEKDSWMLPFVPDSPTASLFFTLSLLYFLFAPQGKNAFVRWSQMIINALGIVCSIKYGVWATAIIIAGAMKGEVLEWQSYMLMASHIAMAVEVMLYARFMKLNTISFLLATAWLLLNDTMDYTFGIYPWLPTALHDDLGAVKGFTYSLSIASLVAGYLSWRLLYRKYSNIIK